MSAVPLLSDSPRVGRRTFLWGGAGVIATQVAGATPAEAYSRPKGVVFTITGGTFSPEVELAPTSKAIVRWLDYRGRDSRAARGPPSTSARWAPVPSPW